MQFYWHSSQFCYQFYFLCNYPTIVDILIEPATFRLFCASFYNINVCEKLYYEDMRERAPSLYLTNVEKIREMMRFAKALQFATNRPTRERATKYDSAATVSRWESE